MKLLKRLLVILCCNHYSGQLYLIFSPHQVYYNSTEQWLPEILFHSPICIKSNRVPYGSLPSCLGFFLSHKGGLFCYRQTSACNSLEMVTSANYKALRCTVETALGLRCTLYLFKKKNINQVSAIYFFSILMCQKVKGKNHLQDHCASALTSVLDQMELLLEGVTVIRLSASVRKVDIERVGE